MFSSFIVLVVFGLVHVLVEINQAFAW